MLAFLVEKKLAELTTTNEYHGKFAPVCHFFGYQGRCAIPSVLDRNTGTCSGRVSKILIENKLTGYCPAVKGVSSHPSKWFPLGIPLLHLAEIK